LPAHVQQHGACAVDVRDGFGIRLAVFDAGDVGDAHGMAVFLANDDVGEFRDGLDATAGAQRHRLPSLIHASAGDLDVLLLERVRHVGDRQVVRTKAIGIEPDVDLARPAAEDDHLAHARYTFELTPQHFVGVFGDVADRFVRGQREAEDGR